MLNLPTPRAEILARRNVIVAELEALIGSDGGQVISNANEIKVYETDGLSCYKSQPLAVVLVDTTQQAAGVVKYCADNRIPLIARGAGTSLSGGALPQPDAVILGLGRMNQVISVDQVNKTAVVQAGVTNRAISDYVDDMGLFYAPDPSSQIACTIGGNVAMNSGGAHCLKYGVTTNHILGVKFVDMSGQIVDIGGEAFDSPSLDLLGLLVGSEGQLGLVTEVTVRLMDKPAGALPLMAGFPDANSAGECVAAIMATGRTPVAIEFMDKPAIVACEQFTGAGYPMDAQAMLIIEVEGTPDELASELDWLREMASKHGATSLKVAENYQSAENIWKGRKSAFGAIGQLTPDYLCMDGTIPVTKLPQVLEQIYAAGEKYGFQIANIFHAGDGNMHPLIMYDSHQPGALEAVEACGGEILQICVDAGGCLTGEHGVGIEKRDFMHLQYNKQDLAQMRAIKSSFDPDWLLNPGKVFPLTEAGVPATLSQAA